jgi:hypothetical protein
LSKTLDKLLPSLQSFVVSLLDLMPSKYQKKSLEAIFGLLLEATGTARAQHCQTKSPASMSRFLNQYDWSTRSLIKTLRFWIVEQLVSYVPKGRKPHLQIIIDLTTLEKRGKFKAFEELIRVYHGKRGLHLVIMYLVMGNWRIPWSYRVYRGKGHPSPAELGRSLLKSLPLKLRKTFKIMVLADSAFSSVSFVTTVRRLKFQAIVGVPKTRKLVDGRSIAQLPKGGQHLYLKDLPFPVSIAHYYFTRDDGRKVKRYLISTRQLKTSTIVWWGKRRWQIEGWFKTIKHRFSLHCFGQGTLLGVHRWLVLCMISFILALWGYWISGISSQPDWGQAAQIAKQLFFPTLLLVHLLEEIKKHRHLAQKYGIEIYLSRWNI